MGKKADISYTEKDIKVLEGLEPVRKKPGMFVGDTNGSGLFQILKEVIDNAIDEYLIGQNTDIYVEIDGDVAIVADMGRGIPVKKHPKTKISTLTTVMTYLHAGGKFSGKNISIGIHGLGVSCTNALSKIFEVWTHREGKWWYQKYSQGQKQTEVINKKPPSLKKRWEKGTIVRFSPDTDIFKKNVKFQVKKVEEWLEDLVYLCPGLKVLFVTGGKEKKFFSADGLKEYIKDLSDSEARIGKPFIFTSDDGEVDVALQWTTADEEIYPFVNCSYTEDGGTHFQGFKKALNAAILAITKAEGFNKEDLRAGLVGVLHVKIPNPNFSSQTKDKLVDKAAEDLVYDILYPEFKTFFGKNKNLADRIVSNAEKLSKAREKFKKDVSAIKQIKFEGKNKKGILPAVLLEATTNNSDEKELYIVEGGSAGGTVKNARDKRIQEVLELTGKFSNAVKTKMGNVLGNDNVKNIIVSVGAGILDKCDSGKARIGKVIFLSDADDDGQHINCLLTTLFAMYMPDMIEDGMVYSVDAPLFIAEWKSKKYFGNSLDDIYQQVGNGSKPIITRLKGWGQLNYKDMETIAMNPSTRKLIKLKLDDNEIEVIEEIMGQDSSARKKILGIAS